MLEKLVRRGALPTVRIGDRVLFRRAELETFAISGYGNS
jgi:excisionase family DNA binding protein